MSDFHTLARAWTYNRQYLGHAAPTIPALLGQLVGLPGAHPSAPLSLLARYGRLTEADYRALEATKALIRMPALRGGAVQLLPAHLAHTVYAATWHHQPAAHDTLAPTKAFGKAWKPLAENIVAFAKTPVSVKQIAEGLNEARPLATCLQAMANTGLLLRVGKGSARSSTEHYVDPEAWLGRQPEAPAPAAALEALAGLYLAAYGPARPQDFAWWAGVPLPEATEAFAQQDVVALEAGYVLLKRHEFGFAEGRLPGIAAIDILPKWDPLTMGFAPNARQRFAPAEAEPHLFDALGGSQAAILLQGLAIGTWSHVFRGPSLRVQMTLFEQPGPALQNAIYTRFGEVADLLNARSLHVEWRLLAEENQTAETQPDNPIAFAEQEAEAISWAANAEPEAGPGK